MATAALASPSKQSPSAMQRRARAGGIDEAPSSTSTARRGHAHGHSSSLSSPPTTLDKLFQSLLPQSAFPSSIVYAASSSTSTSAVIASPVLEASGTRAGEVDYNSRPLSRSSSSSSLHQYASSPQYSSPSSPPHSSASPLGLAAAAGISKSKSRAPRSTVGAGKAAHAHRHNLSIDSSIPYASPLVSSMVTRTRSRTALQSNSNNNARAPSPASFYAGGIGESPANRSRQNSASSSLGSTHITSSMFSHRQSNSSATQQDAHTLKGTLKSPGSSRLNTASSGNTPPTTATSTSTTPAGNTANNTLPSIRGYTTFPDNLNSSIGLSSTRPRTPLLDPFMRYRQQGGQASSSTLHNGLPSESLVGNDPPRLGLLSSSDDPAPSESYVASLALAPLVSRPTRDGQPLYIAGGRTPDTLHAAPSSTYSTPALNASSPSMLYTASNQTGSGALPLTAGPTTRTGTMDSGYGRAQNAGLGMNPLPASSLSRPAMRPRSASVDSYMPQSGQDENNRHTRQHSGGLSGLSHFFHLRSSNSEDKAGVPGRSNSSRHKTRSRKGSSSNNTATTTEAANQSAKIGSRFVHYGQPSPSSRPRTPNSTRSTRARQRSSSFGGAHAREEYQFPERDSPTHPAAGISAHPRGRAPRAGPATNSRANSAFGSSSSLGRSKEDEHQKRTRNKLISARLPRTINHRDARLPSQPLGYTWICGSNSAARTPSFYDEFDYSKYPGGKRKRSISRSTITPRTYTAAGSNAVSRSASNAGTANAAAYPSDELAYESEPEFLARHRARNAGRYGENAELVAGQTRRSVDEATQTTPPSHTPLNEHPQVSLSGGLLTAQEEKALRRRSQSLINLRRTGSKDGCRSENHNIVISHPFRERSSELIRTPRTAPIPLSNEEGLAVPPLFMGESAVIPSPTAASSSTGHGVNHQPPFANMETLAGIDTGRGIRSDAPPAERFRRTPSRASIEAINDPEKRREALFSALPPPTRRSPTPASAVSLHMYPTGKVLSPDPSATSNMASQQQYLEQSDNTPTPRGDVGPPPNADVERLAGASSPPLDDYSQYEASRVIIGESDLLSPANAQERFPIVYGQAFSTAHESHEGEILNASSDSEDLSGLGLQREDSRESKLSRDSLTPLRDVGLVQIQRRQDTSGSAGSSASRSVSNGSARILDLREESFTNLFYRAPPPVKPLPSLPSSQSPSAGGSGSTSGLRSTPSPVPIARQSSASDLLAAYTEDQQPQRPDSRTPEDRFPTPDFSVLQTFDIGDVGSEISSSNRDSRRDTLTHPFARTSTGHPTAAGTSAGEGERRQTQDDWANVDESLLQSGRQIWPISAYEEEENETLMVPPPMARNFTNSTARTVETFYTVGGGTSNASTSAFQAPSLHHQESFASARSHITASSAARTPQAELPPAPSAASAAPAVLAADRGQFIDDHSDDERDRDIMATIRRTDLSPIFVPRPGIPAHFLHQQHARDGTTSPARDSRPTTARESDDEAINSNRDSFIEFEPVVPLRPRAPSDTRSFIDDDSDDDQPTSRPRTSESTTGAGQNTDTKLNRPSVIVEHLEEDDVEQEPREHLNDGGLSSSLQPKSPLTPLTARSAISSVSHYSITPPDIIDTYTRSRESSNDPSRDSQSHYSLGLPITPKVGDRSSGGSHTHSVSNVSIMSSLSKLEDFPEPPPSNTPAYEKDEASAMMHHQPSRSTLGRDMARDSLRPHGSSLPTGPHNQSRATINTQGTQTTSIYTFSSSAEGSGQKEENLEAQPIQRGESSSSQRRNHLFEFPMRRNASKRSTAESFIDTTTSPTRETHTSPSIPSFDPQLGFSSSATSPDLSSPTNDKRPSSPGSSQAQHFRLSGIFARRPKHERTWSDPSTSHLSRSSLAGTRRDSGGFDSHEEKRQSWKGF